MFSQIAGFLRGGESVQSTLTRSDNGMVRLLIQPVLGKEPAGLPADVAAIRAKLARPIVLSGHQDELDARLSEHLAGIVKARNELSAYVEGLINDFSAAKKMPVKQKKAATKSSAAKPVPTTGNAPSPKPAAAVSGADVDLFG